MGAATDQQATPQGGTESSGLASSGRSGRPARGCLGRSFRLLVLILIVLALLVIGVVAVVQWVLWSDVPRATIVRELQSETGLRFEAASSVTRWAGTTELRDVSIALPFEDEPFLRIPVLRLHHTPLATIVAGFEVYAAEVQQPWVKLEQDDSGAWNLAKAMEIVQARQAERPSAGEMPALPRIDVRGGVLDVPNAEGGREEAPFEFSGEPEGPVSWAFALTSGSAVAVSGRLSPRGAWQHQVEAVFGEDQTLINAMVPAELRPLNGAVRWRGGLRNGSFGGDLKIERLGAGELRARGNVEVSALNGRVTLRPRGVEIETVEVPEAQARIVSGAVTLEDSMARIAALRIEGAGTFAELDGQWDLDRSAGELTAQWIGTAIGQVLGHEGQMRIIASLPEFGTGGSAASVQLQVRTSGHVAEGSWASVFGLDLKGSSWQQMAGQFTANEMVWRDEQGPIDASGASARVEVAWPLVRLSRGIVPGAASSALAASLDVPAQVWTLEGEVSGWDVPRVRGGAIDLLVRADGSGTHVEVEELRVRGAGMEARVSGEYNLGREAPLRASARVEYQSPPVAAATGESEDGVRMEIRSVLALAEVSGQIRPLNVQMLGELQGRQLRVGGAPAENVVIPFSANATENGADFKSARFDLLGGGFEVEGTYIAEDRSMALQVVGDAVPLQQVVQAIDVPLQLPGTGGARVRVLVPGLDMDAIEIEGEFAVADVDRPGLRIESGRGELTTRGGVLTLHDLELTAGDARLTGSVEYNLRQREKVQIDAVLEAWPLSLEGMPVTAVVDGRARVQMDLDAMAFTGNVDAAADLAHEGRALGRVSTQAVLAGRSIEVQRIVGELCSGTIDGRAQFSLDDLFKSRLELAMESVDIQYLMSCLGVEDEFAGRMNATVNMGPAADPRAPEPLALVLKVEGDGAAFRTIEFGSADINAFFGPMRTVVDGSTIAIADGELTLFSRLSRHDGDRFLHVQSNLRNLDIDQFYRAFAPEEGPLPGRLSGRAAFGGYIEEPHRMFGESRLALTESDLGNLPAMSMVYNLLSLQLGQSEPTGRGEVRVRLEGNALEITRMRYFNQGADVAATLRVDDVRLGGDSPISGVAAGSVRPLKELNIPLLDVDRMLSTLQSSAATVEIGGTLVDREIQVVPFAQISVRLSRMLTGRVD